MLKLEIVITRAAPAFHKLFMVMGCVFDTNTVHKTVEKLAGAIIITVTNKLLKLIATVVIFLLRGVMYITFSSPSDLGIVGRSM